MNILGRLGHPGRYVALSVSKCSVVRPRPSCARAGLIILGFTGGGSGGTTSDDTRGFQFTVGGSPVSLTMLGTYDKFGDGLLTSHQVGVWTDGGTLLTSTTVPVGTAAVLMNQWRMVNITPITLSANTTYRMGSHVFGDSHQFNTALGPLDPLIASHDDGAFGSPGFTFPSALGGNFPMANGFVVIPEASSAILFGIGLIVICRRRKT